MNLVASFTHLELPSSFTLLFRNRLDIAHDPVAQPRVREGERTETMFELLNVARKETPSIEFLVLNLVNLDSFLL